MLNNLTEKIKGISIAKTLAALLIGCSGCLLATGTAHYEILKKEQAKVDILARKVFKEYDLNKNGLIDSSEAVRIARDFGYGTDEVFPSDSLVIGFTSYADLYDRDRVLMRTSSQGSDVNGTAHGRPIFDRRVLGSYTHLEEMVKQAQDKAKIMDAIKDLDWMQ